MKNKVSELMDGELEAEEVASVINQLQDKNELHKDWQTYHLVGDALRQSSALTIDISQKVQEQLKSEPAILAPKIPEKQSISHRPKKSTLALAASIAIVLVGWISLQTSQESSLDIVADNQMGNTAPVIPVVSPTYAPVEFNDYLFVHGEFAPGTATREPSTYLHQVNDQQDRYRR